MQLKHFYGDYDTRVRTNESELLDFIPFRMRFEELVTLKLCTMCRHSCNLETVAYWSGVLLFVSLLLVYL